MPGHPPLPLHSALQRNLSKCSPHQLTPLLFLLKGLGALPVTVPVGPQYEVYPFSTDQHSWSW